MQDTIFVPSFGNRPRNLVGRDDVLALFNDSFSSIPGSRDRSMLLLGPRESGKTVLLLELAGLTSARKQRLTPTSARKQRSFRLFGKNVWKSRKRSKSRKCGNRGHSDFLVKTKEKVGKEF